MDKTLPDRLIAEFEENRTTATAFLHRIETFKSSCPDIRMLMVPRSDGTPRRKILSPNFEMLPRLYSDVCERLNKRYPQESSKTSAQHLLLRKIQEITSLQPKTNVWIANRNVDVFFPNIGGDHAPGHKGLVLEVDGSIHDQPLKMLKDENKYDVLQMLRIATSSIPNSQVFDGRAGKIIRGLINRPRLDHRGTARVYRRVHIATILCHGTISELSELFGCSSDQIKALLAHQL